MTPSIPLKGSKKDERHMTEMVVMSLYGETLILFFSDEYVYICLSYCFNNFLLLFLFFRQCHESFFTVFQLNIYINICFTLKSILTNYFACFSACECLETFLCQSAHLQPDSSCYSSLYCNQAQRTMSAMWNIPEKS